MTEIHIDCLKRIVAPKTWKRDRGAAPSGLNPESEASYDFDTLFYEAVRTGRDVLLVAPKLLNFRALIRKSAYRIGGRNPGQPRIASYYRHAILRFRNAPPGESLRIEFPDGSVAETPIQPESLAFLAGLNCVLQFNKNNNLDWIRENLAFHSRKRGAEAAVLIENGSTDYGINDLAQMLSKCGLKKAVIISAPYKWGGMNRKPMGGELYLMSSMYNLARIKFLQSARAVLNIDIDEVLARVDGSDTVFDLACKAPLGFLVFHGKDMLPSADATPPFKFSDHRYWHPVFKGANNWCLNPRGPMGKFQWRSHNLEHNVLNKLQFTRQVAFYHCLAMTTGWKGNTRWRIDESLIHDAEAAGFWDTEFQEITLS